MKTIKLLFAIILVATISGNLSAQTSAKPSGQQKTETLKVWGACGMCKERIESTVKAKEHKALWDLKPRCLLFHTIRQKPVWMHLARNWHQ